MNEICGDNRFEIIAKAKAHLLEATNIDTSEDEMKVLDTFLFRCWQMGWLDRYDTADRKTEPQTGVSYSDHTDYDEPKTYVTWTEPQTEDKLHDYCKKRNCVWWSRSLRICFAERNGLVCKYKSGKE